MSAHAEAKQALLAAINECRRAAGIEPLIFDETASAAADAHCAEMVTDNYLSHWGRSGAKPYQRYFDAGCDGHVSENIFGHDDVTDASAVQQQMLDAQASFMAEHDPDDLNKRNTLDWKHTHIGIGVHCTDASFRYVEVYLDRYVSLEAPPRDLDSTQLVLTGRVLDSDKYGPYALTVYHDAPIEELAPEALRAEDKTGGYPDFGQRQVAVTWPWEMSVNEDGTFSIPVAFPEVEAGHYYFQLYLRGEKGTIPYAEHQAGVSVPSDDTICTTGLIALHAGETIVAGDDGGLAEAEGDPITGLELSFAAPAPTEAGGGEEGADDEGGAGETKKKKKARKATPGFEAPLLLGADDRGGTGVTLGIAAARAAGGVAAPGAPFVDMRVLAAASEDEAAAQLPSGFEVVHTQAPLDEDGNELPPLTNLAAQMGGNGPPYVCVCARRDANAGGDGAAPIVEVAVCYGAEGAADPAYTAIEVPLGMEAPVYLLFKRAGGARANGGDDDEGFDDLDLADGDVLLDDDDDEEAALLGEHGDGGEELSPEELAEAEARAVEAEERRREEQRRADEAEAREAEQEALQRAIGEARTRQAALQRQSLALQKQLLPLMKARKPTDATEADHEASTAENEKRYHDALQAVVADHGALAGEQAKFDRIAMDLQGRLDEKEFKANEIAESFRDFKVGGDVGGRGLGLGLHCSSWVALER